MSARVVRIPDIQAKKEHGEKITMLTAYDAWMARILSEAQLDGAAAIDMLLVGDSLGMVELGYDTTVPVTMADMIRHARAVRAGAPKAFIVADMPFLSHQISPEQALRNAGRLMQQAGATAVKLEGGQLILPAVERILSAGIPVMGHLGLQPQSVHRQGGFRRQLTHPDEQRQTMEDALALERAGVFALVLENVPHDFGAELSHSLRVPVIGIGAGPDCDGQVLVTHDILGLTPYSPPFAKRFARLGDAIASAARDYAQDVRTGEFPAKLVPVKK